MRSMFEPVRQSPTWNWASCKSPTVGVALAADVLRLGLGLEAGLVLCRAATRLGELPPSEDQCDDHDQNDHGAGRGQQPPRPLAGLPGPRRRGRPLIGSWCPGPCLAGERNLRHARGRPARLPSCPPLVVCAPGASLSAGTPRRDRTAVAGGIPLRRRVLLSSRISLLPGIPLLRRISLLPGAFRGT